VRQKLHFIGVSTAGSSIVELFPRWAELLGLDAELAGRDIPLGAPAEAFRAAVEEIAGDRRIRGALVTTHKLDVYRHAGRLFTELDSFARLCREVSCISKRDGALVGHAKDPITAGLALDHMLGSGYWAETGAHAVCLGAGGAGTAIVVHLLSLPEPPARIAVTDRDPGRLAALRELVGTLASPAAVEYHAVTSQVESDALLVSSPPGLLVVNATGMGKDTPGSPLSDTAVFPEGAVVWELNYRGELDFLRQARAQAKARGLALYDGWRYFLHGWTEVIAEVFGLELTPERFARLAEAAEPYRARTPAYDA
jgi:shikimate 5-dehydrogenase